MSSSLLAIIPARGGSKGLPRKNILPVGGKPLIAWTITAALEASSIDEVILSSDDDETIKMAGEWGCNAPFVRPARLASDTASSIDVVLHALGMFPGFDYVALLQPTSPLRTSIDIDDAFKILTVSGANSCVSMCLAEESPFWMYRVRENMQLESLLPDQNVSRRQDLPPVYVLNGAIYLARVSWLLQSRNFISEDCVAHIMPRERSLDIDTADDLEELKRVMATESVRKY